MTGPKYCLNYESGDYEWIDEDGFSIDRGEFVFNWDNSEYEREKDEEDSFWTDDDEDDDGLFTLLSDDEY